MVAPLPQVDLIDYLSHRYGRAPFEVAEWPLFDAALFYYASMRNHARDRILAISDRVASNEIAAEIKHYDEKGQLIRSKGKSDPVGFRKHMESLMRLARIKQKSKKAAGEAIAKQFERFLGGFAPRRHGDRG